MTYRWGDPLLPQLCDRCEDCPHRRSSRLDADDYRALSVSSTRTNELTLLALNEMFTALTLGVTHWSAEDIPARGLVEIPIGEGLGVRAIYLAPHPDIDALITAGDWKLHPLCRLAPARKSPPPLE